MRQSGSPTKLRPKVQARTVVALEAGCYLETAAALGVISRRTLYGWLRRGARVAGAMEDDVDIDPEERPFADFLHACEKAMGTFEHDPLKRIQENGAREWTADAWRLERRFPEKYGRRDRVSHHHSRIEVVVHSVPRNTSLDRVGPAFPDTRQSIPEPLTVLLPRGADRLIN